MAQILFTPQGITKYFRSLVIGHNPSGTNGYVKSAIVGPVTALAYFKLGIGAAIDSTLIPANTGVLTRSWYDSAAVDASYSTTGLINANGGKGDVSKVLQLYSNPALGYAGSSRTKKALAASDFYNYGTDDGSKVAGVLSVSVDPSAGFPVAWANLPGIFFQVSCRLAQSEGNYAGNTTGSLDPDNSETQQTALTTGQTVAINEIGIFDVDNVMILYGTFPQTNKSDSVASKINAVAMLKTLDYQLILA